MNDQYDREYEARTGGRREREREREREKKKKSDDLACPREWKELTRRACKWRDTGYKFRSGAISRRWPGAAVKTRVASRRIAAGAN